MQKFVSLCKKNEATMQNIAITKKIEEKTPKQLKNKKNSYKIAKN